MARYIKKYALFIYVMWALLWYYGLKKLSLYPRDVVYGRVDPLFISNLLASFYISFKHDIIHFGT